MAAGFSMLLAKIASLLGWFGSLFVAVFVAFWDIFRDIAAWVFDQVLSVVVAAVAAVDVSGISGNLAGVGSIPANVMEVMGAIGLGQALALIAAGLAVRFALQLIPFTRLGS
jgi:hypothetical protein